MITCFSILILFFGYSRQDITPDVKISIEVPSKEFIREYSNGTVNMYVRRGSNMVLECTIFNKPKDGNTFWKLYPYKGNQGNAVAINKGHVSYDLSRYRIGQGKQPDSVRLEILTVDESYAGIYACEIMYSANVRNAKAERTLMIYDLPEITYTEFKNKVDSGKDITFSCMASGIPAPSVLWRRIGGYSNIIKGTGVVLYSNEVTLKQVTYADAGIYACYAENEWGSIERKFSLQVSHSPIITVTPNGNDAYQRLGCMVQLTCVGNSDPVLQEKQMTWSSSLAGTIKNDSRFSTKFLASVNQEVFYFLRIYPTTVADLTATYTCTGANYLGSGTGHATFRVSDTSNPLITGPFTCGAIGITSSLVLIIISLFTLAVTEKL